jgi:hypothetical protein
MSDNDGEKISEDEYESANDDEMFSKGFCFNPENDSSREEPVDSLDGLRSFLIQKVIFKIW